MAFNSVAMGISANSCDTTKLSPDLLRAALGLIGFTAVTAQIVFMREVMVVFYGNEISLAVMLACWLCWTAVGSYFLGKRAVVRDPRRWMAGLQLFLSLAFPATILALRSSRTVFQATPGEILGPMQLLFTCVAVLSAFCAASGCLFAAAGRLYREETGSSGVNASGSVYLWEAAGSAIGGILASLLLIRYCGSIQIAVLVGLSNLLAAVFLTFRRQRFRVVAAVLLGSIAVAVLSGPGRRLEARSLERLWPGFRLMDTRNSVYGNLATVETNGVRSLFENGLLMFNAPDEATAEEAVHLALLEHPAPKTLLLIGGGASGSLAQALKHPSLERVDYVELDPAVLDVAQQYFPKQWVAARDDPRVFTHYRDGRLFLNSTARSFDVILVDLPDPQTAQLNRFYTLEFFQRAAEKLTPHGILAFQLRGAEEYISPALGAFLRCIRKTLGEVFPVVSMIPGETIHFFGAKQDGALTSDPQELLARLRARQIRTQYVREYFIPFRMMPDRMLELEHETEPQPDTPVNRDLAPVAYFFDVALWSTQFKSAYQRIFESLAQVRFRWIALGVVFLSLVPAVIVGGWFRSGKRERASSVVCVASMGLTLISLEVLLLLGFQALFGYVYYQLSVLTGFLMAGIALGTWVGLRNGTRAVSDPKRRMLTLAWLQGLAVLCAPLFYLLFTSLRTVHDSLALSWASYGLFPVLAVSAGMLGGYQFVVASAVFFEGTGPSRQNLGTLYAVDLLGACVGAFALSSYVLPVFGFAKAGVLIAAINLGAGLLAAWAGWATRNRQDR